MKNFLIIINCFATIIIYSCTKSKINMDNVSDSSSAVAVIEATNNRNFSIDDKTSLDRMWNYLLEMGEIFPSAIYKLREMNSLDVRMFLEGKNVSLDKQVQNIQEVGLCKNEYDEILANIQTLRIEVLSLNDLSFLNKILYEYRDKVIEIFYLNERAFEIEKSKELSKLEEIKNPLRI